MPVSFVRIKECSTGERKGAAAYSWEGFPRLLVCDARDPYNLGTPHSRQLADSRDFPTETTIHAKIDPNFPMVWEDCDANEVEGDERNVVQRILKIFQAGDTREPPVVLAADVFRDTLRSSKYGIS